MKVAFYFNDYEEANETGTFTAFTETKQQVLNLKGNKIEYCCIIESEKGNNNLVNEVETFVLQDEHEKLLNEFSKKYQI